jgi:hypothetical protein
MRSVRAVDNLKTILAPTRSVPHTACYGSVVQRQPG